MTIHQPELSQKICKRLLAAAGGLPDFNQLAAELALHPRTLRRRLAAEGTSYRALRASVCWQLAQHYQANTQLTHDEIAERLGLADGANFRQALRRWRNRALNERAGEGACKLAP